MKLVLALLKLLMFWKYRVVSWELNEQSSHYKYHDGTWSHYPVFTIVSREQWRSLQYGFNIGGSPEKQPWKPSQTTNDISTEEGEA